ncbi:sensor histidine kinase [Cellulomonas pakistanensis]|uniref:histidine kinase n=1 Tax=Cellulomonas pakistanensis TaxID=992287 RepID=A0A919P7Q3_9CELL|nr:histidine kinase [Cellulomonas pakistanensis]GIG35143.1 two-component sensor histidine kinase [Cellulomonas pakistanensis]
MTWWEQFTRWEERHQLPIDATLTVLTGLLVVPLAAGTASSWQVSPVVVAAFAVLAWAPLAWRRRYPVASVVAVYAACLLHLLVGVPLILPSDLAVLLALYSVTVHGPRWAHLTAMGSALVGNLAMASGLLLQSWSGSAASMAASGIAIWMFASVTALAVWAFGLVRRSRRVTIAALRDRAERLEVERDQQATIATAAERTRIAREMHDIVAHSLSVVVAQADGGRYAAAADPEAATRALGTIAETGRAALADMRRLLGVLREPERTATGAVPAVPGPGHGAAPGQGEAAPYSPQPAEHDLESLVEQVRSSGVRASLVRMGTPRRLPPGIGLTVYRICQEALTNVLKHGGPDVTVTVLAQWQPAALVLEITDDGRGAAADSDGAGQGLLGMRERASMIGGSLSAGPRPGGGFRVRAELPLPPGAPAADPGAAIGLG